MSGDTLVGEYYTVILLQCSCPIQLAYRQGHKFVPLFHVVVVVAAFLGGGCPDLLTCGLVLSQSALI